MQYDDLLAYSTAAIVQTPHRRYINARHAADRYVYLRERSASCPSIDLSEPIVQTSPKSGDVGADLTSEKLTLEAIFFAAGRQRRLTREQCRVWYLIRIAARSYRGIDGIHRSKADRWVKRVDHAIDMEIDRRGLLVCGELVSMAKKRGMI